MAELLKLKAKHFKDADFESCFDCPIAKAGITSPVSRST